MNPFYPLVANRANHRCEYCHAPELVFNFPFEVEHIVPMYRGGADAEFNLALACRSCNLRKGTRISAVDPESKTEVPLFHPRQDTWNEHFRVDIEVGTAIGRATIVCLEMNSQPQIIARQLWIRLGLFP
ncbi:HNH endonuclease signature motif containing protein [Chlorogloeopsis sp. ULAP01]|uniref:HNH endonuclease n=1 Tax=Chlorogloeopsis sp. ULAP01 TaxID=3056483 RepID=UPI0025AB31F9|nr:HNH endonuclease signature motif containing protein [Chlorogloeopsis sp. ULAP01]MDM9382578.1 HNH endonuclease signature motif containing protein [Chlorogloeopsis sp. ULAP01]